jgi:hypothetical protein
MLVASIYFHGQSLNKVQTAGLCLAIGSMLNDFLGKNGRAGGHRHGGGGGSGREGLKESMTHEAGLYLVEVRCLIFSMVVEEDEEEEESINGGVKSSSSSMEMEMQKIANIDVCKCFCWHFVSLALKVVHYFFNKIHSNDPDCN